NGKSGVTRLKTKRDLTICSAIPRTTTSSKPITRPLRRSPHCTIPGCSMLNEQNGSKNFVTPSHLISPPHWQMAAHPSYYKQKWKAATAAPRADTALGKTAPGTTPLFLPHSTHNNVDSHRRMHDYKSWNCRVWKSRPGRGVPDQCP